MTKQEFIKDVLERYDELTKNIDQLYATTGKVLPINAFKDKYILKSIRVTESDDYIYVCLDLIKNDSPSNTIKRDTNIYAKNNEDRMRDLYHMLVYCEEEYKKQLEDSK